MLHSHCVSAYVPITVLPLFILIPTSFSIIYRLNSFILTSYAFYTISYIFLLEFTPFCFPSLFTWLAITPYTRVIFVLWILYHQCVLQSLSFIFYYFQLSCFSILHKSIIHLLNILNKFSSFCCWYKFVQYKIECDLSMYLYKLSDHLTLPQQLVLTLGYKEKLF